MQLKPQILIILLFVMIITGLFPVSLNAQSIEQVIGKGELCSEGACFSINVSFPPGGGDVTGDVKGSVNISNPPQPDCVLWLTGTFDGTFEGGDGGALIGNFAAEQNTVCSEASVSDAWGGSWSGNLYANGTGSGTWSAPTGFGTWVIYYSAQEFQEILTLQQSTVPPMNTPFTPTAELQSATDTPNPILTPTLTPTVVVMDATVEAFLNNTDSQAFAKEQIQRLLTHDWSQGPYTQPLPYIVWLNNRVVNLSVDENQQPYVIDEEGNTVKINEEGQPLEDYSNLGSSFTDIPEIQEVPPMDLVDYLLILQQQVPEEMAPIVDIAAEFVLDVQNLNEDLTKFSSEELKLVLKNLDRIKQAGFENNIQGFQQVINRYLLYQANMGGNEQAKLILKHDIEAYGVVGLMERWQYLREDMIRIREKDTSKPELIEVIDKVLEYPGFYDSIPTDANLYIEMQKIRMDQYEFERLAYQKRDAAQDSLEKELGDLRLKDAINQLAENNLITNEMAQLYTQRVNQGMLKTKDIREISKQYKTFQSILAMQAPPPASPTGLKATDALLKNKIVITLGEMFDD